MDRKLINYLPYIVRDYAEFQGITGAEQPEFENAWAAVDDLLANQFIKTAGNLGLSRWEKILGITPKGTDTLDDRRSRVLSRLNEELPYTYRWLTNWLRSLCGVDNPAPTIDGYSIQIKLPSGVDYLRILADLRQRISANLVIAPCVQLVQAEAKLYIGAAVRIAAKQTLTVGAAADNLTVFMDESDAVLTDEGDKILYVEATP